MSVKERAIQMLIRKGIDSINKNVDLSYIVDNVSGEARSINFEIIDSQNITTGFALGYDKGKPIMKEIGYNNRPTVTLQVTKDTFLALCLQKITLEEAILYGDANLVGNNWLRDFRLFQPIFRGFKKVLEDVVPSD